MATPSSIILRGLQLLGDKIVGDTLTANEQTTYLAVLNSFLDSCRIDRLFVFRIVENTFTLTIGASAYTIGTGGNFNIARPDRIVDTCFILYQNAEYPVQVVDEVTFTAQQTAGQSQMPRQLYYDVQVPLATVYFDYTPDKAYEFHLKSWSALQSFATISDTVNLPSGYQRFLEYNMAIEMSGGYLAPSAEVIRIARESKAAIRAFNTPASVLQIPPGVAQSNRLRGSILRGA